MITTPAADGRPWMRAALWLAFLAPFFYVTYGFANWLAAQRSDVGAVVFDWERQIPFLAWTIVPYWSINLFYGLSLLVCGDREELSVHGRRLLATQLIAVACFLLFPLRLTFERPPTDGLPGFMFDALTSFDRPFNQAPSLHIALLVILGDLYVRHLGRLARIALVAWFVVVGLSVLTTWQHHFIDIPTGIALGATVVGLLPWHGASPLAAAALTGDARRRRLALSYGGGALLAAVVAVAVGGAALWLLWATLALALVALAYLVLGPAAFQKGADGQRSAAACLLLAPYLVGAWINARLWTRHDPPAVEVADGVSIARMPRRSELAHLPAARLVDLCAELAAPNGLAAYRPHVALDLVPVDPRTLRAAAASIEELRQNGPVVVTCALGYGRSAAAIAAWLVLTGRSADSAAALVRIRAVRPRATLDERALAGAIAAARPAGLQPSALPS